MSRSRKLPFFVWPLVAYTLLALGYAWHGWHALKPPVSAVAVLNQPSYISQARPTLPPVIAAVPDLPAAPSNLYGADAANELSHTILVNQKGETAKILMYHYIRDVDPKKDPLGFRLSVSPALFAQQLAVIHDAGYSVITMADLMAHKGGPKTVVLTFDDGYEDFYTTAYPLLQHYGWKATLYIISGKIGGPYMSWQQIQDLHTAGFEIGAHTVDHPSLDKLTPEQQHHEIFDSKATLEQEIGAPVTAFCYPSGRYNATTVQLVKQAGFTSATTTKGGIATTSSDAFLLPRLRIDPSVTPDLLAQALSR